MDDTLHATAFIPMQVDRRAHSWGLQPMTSRFTEDTRNHQMQVCHDQGLYRHLLFTAPATPICSFQIFTTPGSLAIAGDMGTYVFARLEDMFRFFDAPSGRINPDYWSQKVTAQDVHCPVRKYSSARFRDVVLQDYHDRRYEFDPPVQERLLSRISFEILQSHSLEYEPDAREILQRFEFCFRPADGRPEVVFDYADADSWDFKDYSHHFLWCLEAVVFGIARYREVTGNV